MDEAMIPEWGRVGESVSNNEQSITTPLLAKPLEHPSWQSQEGKLLYYSYPVNKNDEVIHFVIQNSLFNIQYSKGPVRCLIQVLLILPIL